MSDRPSAERTREQCVWDTTQEWLASANDDLACATAVLELSPPSLQAAAFHSRQAAEKLVKRFPVRHQVEFDRTHDIADLVEDMRSVSTDLAENLQPAIYLTQWAVARRYPGGPEPADEQAVAELIATAQSVTEIVREALREYLDQGRPE